MMICASVSQLLPWQRTPWTRERFFDRTNVQKSCTAMVTRRERGKHRSMYIATGFGPRFKASPSSHTKTDIRASAAAMSH